MSDHTHSELEQLRIEVMRLTRRIDDLEGSVRDLRGEQVPLEPLTAPPSPAQAPAAAPATGQVPGLVDLTPEPVMDVLPAEPVAPQAPAPPVAAPPPKRPPAPPRPPFDWGKFAEGLFAARTLAWAGGLATALGIVLLFVMAASRGWVTPAMRVGLGAAVSLGMLGAALELDRRKWRADAILAAAGVGVAGLYATLWAASWLYDFFGSAVAAGLAALVAAVAVAVGIRIRQEPLAIFGVSGAMLAPVAISGHVEGAGVLYATVMMAATLPLFWRLRWRRLLCAAWLIGAAEAVALIAVSVDHIGFGVPVAAVASVALVLVAMSFLVELLPSQREQITPLGWGTAGSAFTLSLGGSLLFAGHRLVDGHSLLGLTLFGVAAGWTVLALVPSLARRSHPDFTDLLAAFALTAAAAATGLLAGGPAQVCAWAAESAVLIGLAERISRRSKARQVRISIAAGIYFALAGISTARLVVPTPDHLPRIGAGDWQGLVALAAMALAGIVLCTGLRWLKPQEQSPLWLLPALAIGYMPLWSLPAEWAVVAYAGMAAALLLYRRTPLLVAWLDDRWATFISAAWWTSGLATAAIVTAPLSDLRAGWAALGLRHGVPGLAALTLAAVVFTWSVRRPHRRGAEFGLLVPVVMSAYLLGEVLPVPYAIWAWLGVAAALSAVVHVRPVRRALLAGPLLAGSTGMLILGLVAAWGSDHSLMAVSQHGRTTGWESIALAVAVAFIRATADLDPRRRTYSMWVPFVLAGQLSAMLLPGQYPLVAIAGLSSAVSLVAFAWPGVLQRRLDRPATVWLGAVPAVALFALVLGRYETPSMLFRVSHTPASGLAAAAAATVALFLAAAAGRRGLDDAQRIGGARPATALVTLAAASGLWSLAAAFLGATQMLADASSAMSIHDRFQQGHVAISISWVLIGLALVVISLRGGRRGIRFAGTALLFVALGKLFLFDLAFLTAMARAASFIVTGSILLFAALLLQRFSPQVKTG